MVVGSSLLFLPISGQSSPSRSLPTVRFREKGEESVGVHIGILKTCIFLRGCCANPDPDPDAKLNPYPWTCGVLAGRMKEANAALVDRIGLMSREVIMNTSRQGLDRGRFGLLKRWPRGLSDGWDVELIVSSCRDCGDEHRRSCRAAMLAGTQ